MPSACTNHPLLSTYLMNTTLELEVPIVAAVFLPGEEGDLIVGDLGERLGGVPGLAEGELEGFRGELEIHQEVGVGTVGAVGRLAGGQGKRLAEQVEVQIQQEGAVEDQAATVAALGVAGEFQAAEGEVGLALALDGSGEQRGERGAVAFEDQGIGGGDGVAGAW